MAASLHDAYAADYDAQMQAYACYLPEVLFGLCYEYIQPGQRLLDAGIGSGLSAQLFARAGLEVYGMDFSPAMVEVCRAKGFAADLTLHDLQHVPWPYPPQWFDHLVCCGVMHFIPELTAIVAEARRLLVAGGLFAFTTRLPASPGLHHQPYEQHIVGDFEIFSHTPAYVETLLSHHAFARLKTQKCFVGDDQFILWIAAISS